MLYPSIDELVKKTDSKYSLVVAASRRARQLREGDRTELHHPKSHKYVGMALEEIYDELILIEQQPELHEEAEQQ
ncbi:DNA-directed RNA polymerase subunit omega [Paenibacillus marinisediminis]